MTDVAKKVVARFLLSSGGFGAAVESTMKAHARLQQWLKGFPQHLRQAVGESGQLSPGRVWSKFISDFWGEPGGYNDTLEILQNLKDSFDDVLSSEDYLWDDVNLCQDALRVPRDAQVDVVLASVGFEKEPPPGAGPTWALSYDVATVERWARALGAWSEKAEGSLKRALQSGKRKIKRRAR